MHQPQRLFTYEQDFSAFVSAVRSGERCLVDEELFYYYLGVLPPQFLNRRVQLIDGSQVDSSFGFAEGCEPIVAFWKEGEAFFAQRTNQTGGHVLTYDITT